MNTSLPTDAVIPLAQALVAVLARGGPAVPLLVAAGRPVGAVATEVPGVIAVPTAVNVSHFVPSRSGCAGIAPLHFYFRVVRSIGHKKDRSLEGPRPGWCEVRPPA